MRALKIGIPEYAHTVSAFAHAHTLLNAADSRVERQLHSQLGQPRAKVLKEKSKPSNSRGQ